VNKMFELGASTKGSQRGFGLSNVQQLVDKQKNFFLDVDSKSDRVIITLTILEEEWLFPIYLYEDNAEQRDNYCKTVNNTIMINEFAMELRVATDDQKLILADLNQ